MFTLTLQIHAASQTWKSAFTSTPEEGARMLQQQFQRIQSGTCPADYQLIGALMAQHAVQKTHEGRIVIQASPEFQNSCRIIGGPLFSDLAPILKKRISQMQTQSNEVFARKPWYKKFFRNPDIVDDSAEQKTLALLNRTNALSLAVLLVRQKVLNYKDLVFFDIEDRNDMPRELACGHDSIEFVFAYPTRKSQYSVASCRNHTVCAECAVSWTALMQLKKFSGAILFPRCPICTTSNK